MNDGGGCIYDSATTIGPDDVNFPAGIYRDADYPGDWCPIAFLDFDNDANLDLPRTPGAMNVTCPVTGIPTVSEWGMAVMTLLVLSAGTIVLMRRRVATT